MNNAFRRPVRAAVLALAAKAYGQDSYFRALLPALDRYAGDAEFVVLTLGHRYREVVSSRRIQFLGLNADALRSGSMRVLWEQIVLPGMLARLDVDVVYT